MSVKLNTASGGSVTLAPENTASNVTLTVPALAGSFVTADASGNVGIGTSSPDGAGTRLQIKGTNNVSSLGCVSNDNGAHVTLYSGQNSSDNPAVVFANSLRFANGTPSTSSFTERMRIDSSGNLLVGTTTTSLAGSGQYFNALGQRFCSVGSGGQWSLFQNASGTTIGSIQNNGNTSTSYNTSSDYRLKENVQPMQNALDIVAQLKPCTYKWKADGSEGQGFIAHELQAVVPDCVTGEKDAVEIVDEFDDDGKKIGTKEVPQYQGVDTSFLVATLTAAIQELNAKVDSLQAEVDSLKGGE